MRAKLLLILLACLPLALPAVADHCEGYQTSSPEADTGTTAAGRYYVDVDISQFDPLALWVYEESNGIDGLQREDEIVDDTCHAGIRGDTIIF